MGPWKTEDLKPYWEQDDAESFPVSPLCFPVRKDEFLCKGQQHPKTSSDLS